MADKKGKSGGRSSQQRRYSSSVDVARLAGVSQSAVSRTFTEGASVSEETRAKVLEAAAQLGYGPSLIPKIMLTNQSFLIAVVSGGMYNPFYASVVEGICRRIRQTGSNVVLFTVEHDDPIDAMIPDILGFRVDGIISALTVVSPAAAERCAKVRVPLVLCNGRTDNEWVASVCSDNVSGGRKIANLFIEKGAKNLAVITGNKDNMASDDRLAGFLSGVFSKGQFDVKMEEGTFRYESGYDAALRLFDGCGPRPDAVFCVNDLMAIGAIEAIRSKLGLRVPQDVMIAGFDDIAPSAWPSIGVTTIRQDADKLVEGAVDLLDRLMADAAAPINRHHLLPIKLIERGSTDR